MPFRGWDGCSLDCGSSNISNIAISAVTAFASVAGAAIVSAAVKREGAKAEYRTNVLVDKGFLWIMWISL